MTDELAAVPATAVALARHGAGFLAVREQIARLSAKGARLPLRALRKLLAGLARASGRLTGALERAVQRLDALEGITSACPLLPAEWLLEADEEPVAEPRTPPPIPAAARRGSETNTPAPYSLVVTGSLMDLIAGSLVPPSPPTN